MRIVNSASTILVSCILVAVIAPPIALALWLPSQSLFRQVGANGVLILVGFSYVIGAIPSFVAGVALRPLSLLLTPWLAAFSAAAVAVLVLWGLTRRTSLFAEQRPLVLCALAGVTVASWLVAKLLGRRSSAEPGLRDQATPASGSTVPE